LNFQVYDYPDHPESVFDLSLIPETNEYLAMTSAFFIGMPYPQIVRINNELDIIDNSWFQASELENPCSFGQWTNNETFLFSSLSIDYEGNDDQVGIYKTDTNANIIKALELGKSDTLDYPAWFNNIACVNETTIYVGGFVNFPGLWTTEPSYIELYLIDSNINLLGYKQFGGEINYQLNGITSTADDGCLLYASTFSDNNHSERDIRIFKVPRDSVEIITQITDLPAGRGLESAAYPNPVSDIINILLDDRYQNVNIQIFRIDGKKVYDAAKTGSGNLISINVNHLPTGVYIYKLTSFGQIFRSGKFVK